MSRLIVKARGKPSCLASQARDYVFEYTAPQISGGGTVRIALWHGVDRAQFWPGDISLAKLRSSKPDALIVCNAGLASYNQWRPVILASRAFKIPFAVTDYREISLDLTARVIQHLPQWQHHFWPNPDLTPVEQQRLRETPALSFKFGPNPFMRPGPGDGVWDVDGGPYAINGHEMVVTPGPKAPNNSV